MLPESVAEQPADDWRAPGWQPVQTPAPRLEVAPEPERAPEPVAERRAEPEPSSSSRRRARAAFQPTFEPVADRSPTPAFEPEPAFEPVDELPDSEPTDERPSIWKRELSFGRKKQCRERRRIGLGVRRAPDPETPDVRRAGRPAGRGACDRGRGRRRRDRRPASRRRRTKAKKEKRTARRGARARAPAAARRSSACAIGASQIAAAHVQTNGSHELLKLARMPLERGVVVAGELRDPDALAVALRVFFKQNKLPKRSIRLGIASNRVGVRVLDVPGVEDPTLLGNAVRFRAQEVLPIPLSEAVLDYRVLRERHDEDGTVREVLVAFAYRELVDRYTECLPLRRPAPDRHRPRRLRAAARARRSGRPGASPRRRGRRHRLRSATTARSCRSPTGPFASSPA